MREEQARVEIVHTGKVLLCLYQFPHLQGITGHPPPPPGVNLKPYIRMYVRAYFILL